MHTRTRKPFTHDGAGIRHQQDRLLRVFVLSTSIIDEQACKPQRSEVSEMIRAAAPSCEWSSSSCSTRRQVNTRAILYGTLYYYLAARDDSYHSFLLIFSPSARPIWLRIGFLVITSLARHEITYKYIRTLYIYIRFKRLERSPWVGRVLMIHIIKVMYALMYDKRSVKRGNKKLCTYLLSVRHGYTHFLCN